MSGFYDSSDLFEEEVPELNSGSGLRRQLEEALGEIRSLRNELNQEKRQKTLAELFTEKGKDPAAAILVPEGVDPKEWLEKNGAFVADAKKEPQLVAPEEPAAPEVPTPDPALDEERMAFETLQGLGLGLPGTGIPSTASADPIQKLKSFQSEEELMNFIRSQGA